MTERPNYLLKTWRMFTEMRCKPEAEEPSAPNDPVSMEPKYDYAILPLKSPAIFMPEQNYQRLVEGMSHNFITRHDPHTVAIYMNMQSEVCDHGETFPSKPGRYWLFREPVLVEVSVTRSMTVVDPKP